MQELEKILEEIDIKIARSMGKKREGLLEAREILSKHMKNEEDILKFYYCESEDDYYLGQRVENMYYARYGDGAFTWFMSHYLPWGEKGYPNEPKEIPFVQWIEGFIRKYINDGWIPVEERLPEEGWEVLVWYEYFRYGDYNRMYETYGIGWQYDGHWSGDVSGTKARCIAWRPLPESYRPERNYKE